MWMYLSIILLGVLFVLFLFFDSRYTRLLNRLAIKIRESNELKETITSQNNTIRSLENKINQISVTDGISPEYRVLVHSADDFLTGFP